MIIISNEFPPRGGGAGVIAKNMAELDGYKVIYPKFTTIVAFGLKLKVFKYFWFLELTARCLCHFLIRGPKTDVVLNDFGALVAYYFTPFKSGFKNTIFIHHGLISESNSFFKSGKERFMRFVLKSENIRSVYVSKFIKNKVEAKNSIKGGVFYFRRYCNVAKIEPLAEKGLKDKFIVFSACRINRQKLPENVFDFLAEISKSMNVKILFQIAGLENDYSEKILRKAISLNQKHLEVEFLGVLEKDGIANGILEADWVLNCSLLEEGAPMLGYEAAACSTPYVYFTETGHSEVSFFNEAFTYRANISDPREVLEAWEKYLVSSKKIHCIPVKPPKFNINKIYENEESLNG